MVLVVSKIKDIVKVQPSNLLSDTRFDLVIKSNFVNEYRKKNLSRYSDSLYTRHINIINGFVENDGSGKVGKDRFLIAFKELIDSIESNGFDENFPIPINKEGNIVDGAHRLSCMVTKKDPILCNIIDKSSINLDYSFFKERGFSGEDLDYLSIKYCELDSSLRIITFWPKAATIDESTMKILNKYGSVITKVEHSFSFQGLVEVVKVAYSKEKWLGGHEDNFSGAQNKAKWCFDDKNKTSFFLFKPNKDSDLVEMKESIRDQYKLEKHALHINDTWEESIELAKVCFNNNTVDFFNRKKGDNKMYTKLILDFVSKANCVQDLENYLIVGGTLTVFGIKNSKDLDYFCLDKSKQLNFDSPIDFDCEKLSYIDETPLELLSNPRNYFYHCGLKFLSLERCKELRINRQRDTDRADIDRIDHLLKGSDFRLDFFLYIKDMLRFSFWKIRIKFVLLKIRYLIFKIMLKK